MTTFADLVTAVSEELKDPSNKTFSSTAVGDMVNLGLVEIGRIAPARFQVDIVPVANALEYTIRDGAPEIGLTRVEPWDKSSTPYRYLGSFRSAAGEFENSSGTGWKVWSGKLYLTNGMEAFLDPATMLLRVWGYGPYPIVSGSTAMPCSVDCEYAIRAYCKVEALQRLVFDRDLFAQWQTQNGASDASPGSILSALSLAQEDWRRKQRQLLVLREPS